MLSSKQDYVGLKLDSEPFEIAGERDDCILDQLLCQAQELGPNENTTARYTFLSQNHRVNGSLRVCPFEDFLNTAEKEKMVLLARQSTLVAIERGSYRRKYQIDPSQNAPLADSILEINGMTALGICKQLNDFAEQLGAAVPGIDHPTYVFLMDSGNARLTLKPHITWGLTSRHYVSIESAAQESEFVTIHRKKGSLRFRIKQSEPFSSLTSEDQDSTIFESGEASPYFLSDWNF